MYDMAAFQVSRASISHTLIVCSTCKNMSRTHIAQGVGQQSVMNDSPLAHA